MRVASAVVRARVGISRYYSAAAHARSERKMKKLKGRTDYWEGGG